MKKKSMKQNAVLNIIRTCMAVVFPLITFPYVSRVLGVSNMGQINYGLSIVSYFSLLAMVGINVFAIREGSKIRENKEKFSQFGSEIFSLSIITTIISYLVLFIFLFFTKAIKPYSALILLQSMTIIFTTLSIDWVNVIYEDYLVVTIRTIGMYIISLVLMFLFVKSPTDYYIYAGLSVLSNCLICIFNQTYCRKYIKLKFTISKNFMSYLKQSLIFFANNVAIQLYVNIDITMLGALTTDYTVGIYSTAVKVYSIIKGVLAAIYTVAISRLSFYVGEKRYSDFKNTITNLTVYLMLILFPCMIGLIMCADEIILILAGEAYLTAATSLRILSVALIFAIFGGLINNCINIPLGKEKINVKATSLSAIINVVLNLILIPVLQEKGAAITTVISEVFVFTYCFLSYKKWNELIEIKKVKRVFFQVVLASIGILLVNILISFIIVESIVVQFILKVLVSFIVYVLILIIVRNEELKKIMVRFVK